MSILAVLLSVIFTLLLAVPILVFVIGFGAIIFSVNPIMGIFYTLLMLFAAGVGAFLAIGTIIVKYNKR